MFDLIYNGPQPGARSHLMHLRIHGILCFSGTPLVHLRVLAAKWKILQISSDFSDLYAVDTMVPPSGTIVSTAKGFEKLVQICENLSLGAEILRSSTGGRKRG